MLPTEPKVVPLRMKREGSVRGPRPAPGTAVHRGAVSAEFGHRGAAQAEQRPRVRMKVVPTETDEIYQKITQLLAPINTHGIALTPDTDLSADLSIDSVAVMDLVMELEDVFEIDVPLNLLSDVRTVRDLVAVVAAQQAKG